MVPQGSQAGHISQPLPSEEETAKNIDRLLFFSDAVFAIILTLTAIDLKLPAMCSSATAPGAGKDCWLDAWTMVGAARIPLVTYLSSFLIVSVIWALHHMAFTSRLQAFNYGLVWRNLLSLMLLGLIPFTTKAINDNPESSPVATLYGLGMIFPLVAFFWLWAYASSGSNALMRSGGPTIVARHYQIIGSIIVIVIGLFANIYLAVFSKASFPGFVQVVWLVIAVIAVQAQIMGERFNGQSTIMEVGMIIVVIAIAAWCTLIPVEGGKPLLLGEPNEFGFALLYVPPLLAIVLLVINIVRSGRVSVPSPAASGANGAIASNGTDPNTATTTEADAATSASANTIAPSGTDPNTAATTGADDLTVRGAPVRDAKPLETGHRYVASSSLLALLLFLLGLFIGRRR